jgi:hypothetical protein
MGERRMLGCARCISMFRSQAQCERRKVLLETHERLRQVSHQTLDYGTGG